MNDDPAEVSTICPAFAWVVREGTIGPIAVPLRELTQRQWDQIVRQLDKPARRRMRIALEEHAS